MKSEPDTFSIDDLAARPNRTEPWDGVRNYQVRNMFRDQMKVGDTAFFYHSNCEVPGIYGVMTIASPAYVDPTQFEAGHHHYDPGSKPDQPRWLLVDVKYRRRWKRPVSLATLKDNADALAGLQVIAKGNRLSVMPVRPEHWAAICALAGEKP